MKIVFNRQKIISVAAPLLCAVSNKTTVMSIEGILIEAKEPNECIMTTYDTEKGVRLPVDVDVFEGGSCIINAQKFFSIIKVMPENEVTLTVSENRQATFTCGTSIHKTLVLPGSDFPELPKLRSNFGFTVSQHVVKSMMSKCQHAMAVADLRPILNGCYFDINSERMLAVSCDSFRVAMCSLVTDIQNNNENGSNVNFRFVLPIRTVNEVYKLLDGDAEKDLKMRLYVTRHEIIFIIGQITFFSALIEGQYIDYNRIVKIPVKGTFVAERVPFLESLIRARLITEESIEGHTRPPIKLEVEGDSLAINAVNVNGSYNDLIPVSHDGDDLSISFNNKFLIDALTSSEAEKVKFSFSSTLSGITIEPAEPLDKCTELFMILPVRNK